MLIDREGIEVHIYSSAGCSAANLLRPVAAMATRCPGFFASSLQDISVRSSPGDAVLLASLRIDRFVEPWGSRPAAPPAAGAPSPETRSTSTEQALDEASRLVAELADLGLAVIIQAPGPVFKIPVFRCSDWFNSVNPICLPGPTVGRDELLERRRPAMQSIARLQVLHPALRVWDPFPVLCPNPVCSVFDGDKPLFFDGDHFSAHGNRVLYPSLIAVLAEAWRTEPSDSKGR
jgi:hypothetical protein